MTTRRRLPKLCQRFLSAVIPCVALLALLNPITLSKTSQTQKSPTDTTTVKMDTPAPLVIRVGAIYYDDSAEQYSRIRSVLSDMENYDQQVRNKTDPPITFKLEVGTYDEVMSWYKSGQIDLAIMNPGPLALILNTYSQAELDKAFVGIRSNVPRKTSVASQHGMQPRSEYSAIMLLNRQAMIEKNPSLNRNPNSALSPEEEQSLIDFVLRKATERQAHFLFVHPFSTSGFIFPRKFLREHTNVDLTPSEYEITYSHNVSVREIAESGYDHDNRLKVAFVSDETEQTLHDPKVFAIRRGVNSGLDTKIVQDALILTPEFVQREGESQVARIKELLLRRADAENSFNLSTPKNWRQGYEQVKTWIRAFDGSTSLANEPVTMDQIIRRISNYNRHHEPARVALVLSGGGAKCAYQLGAVEVIEDKLRDAENRNPGSKLGIDLVVGTSGGAINALTVAAEVTKEPQRRLALKSTWNTFAQAEILKPSNFVRQLLGVSIGLTIVLIIVFIMHLLLQSEWVRAKPQHAFTVRTLLRKLSTLVTRFADWSRISKIPWSIQTGMLMLIAALVIYLGQTQISLTSWLPSEELLQQHALIHIAEYGRQTLRWAAMVLLLCGLVLCLDWYFSSQSNKYLEFSREWRVLALVLAVICALTLPFYTLYTTFVVQHSLFVSAGIEEKMAVEIPKLLGCDVNSGPFPRSLGDISKEIIEKGLIKRDLVITGSMLPTKVSPEDYRLDSDDADTDLYFVYKANGELPKTLYNDNRFVSLKESPNESILLDAVIGSGSIFPAFEPRRLEAVKRVRDNDSLKKVSIIDGGFVHNSPIEAAIKLKATHIIVIEASPRDQPFESKNLINNSVAAFSYLFAQAQLLDARSQRQAEIFTLRPAAQTASGVPYLCTLDFGENYIKHAMTLGRQDASNIEVPQFKRQPRPSGF